MSGFGPNKVRSSVAGFAGIASLVALAVSGAQAGASPGLYGAARSENTLRALTSNSHSADALSIEEASAYGLERTAPALTVSGKALAAAEAQAASLPVVGSNWTQLSTGSDNAQPNGYTDPVWSNAGAGFRDVSGRATALAADGSTIYAGFADGGVWKTTDGGQHWTPIFDKGPTLSIGSLAVNPADHSLWAGTGEANTNADSYAGQGVFRSTDGGASWSQVGGSELSGFTSYRLVFDGHGIVYDASNNGLWRRSASTIHSPWTLVLKPDPNPTHNPYQTSFITDVVIVPGSGGASVLAADGWRGQGNPPADTAYNGFYMSTNHGLTGTFSELTLTGAINTGDLGRTTFAYSKSGSKLYAMIEAPSHVNLQGIFLSANGNPSGPWTLIANSTTLCNSGSGGCSTGVPPGVQAWYNEFLAVDPNNEKHVFAGLEEVYQTFDAGATWTTISPYWNYAFPCDATNTCPPVTHPDQHAVLIVGGKVYIGNDGGIYSRGLNNTAPMGGWTDLNNTLHTLQYYDAEAGAMGSGLAEWGGLQDNGTSLLRPGSGHSITPAGGDGGDVIVNPANAMDMVGEYVDLNPYLTTDGGHTFLTISPSCFSVIGPFDPTQCDPTPRFIAPLATDVNNPNHWVAGGEFVWDDTAAWATVCQPAATPPGPCSWTNVHDTGAGHSITALAVNGSVTYAGWCGNCNIGGSPPFASGIDTNYGGTWHTVSAPNLPNRFVAGLTVDPANPAHVFAVYNGYSRRWIPGGGTGHVFESTDGGATWTDISVLLPDVPSDALVLSGGKLLLATDIGAFIANAVGGTNTAWARLGTNLPNTSLNDLRLDPNGTTVLAATHGRGLWRIRIP
jgi:photosystem II stability/assembly factor-like uncharacterized protein